MAINRSQQEWPDSEVNQHELFGYSRQDAIALYRRVKAYEQTASAHLRDTILVPMFGGNLCRMHNFVISCKQGRPDDDPRKLRFARYYERQQRIIWDNANRLQKHFAQYF